MDRIKYLKDLEDSLTSRNFSMFSNLLSNQRIPNRLVWMAKVGLVKKFTELFPDELSFHSHYVNKFLSYAEGSIKFSEIELSDWHARYVNHTAFSIGHNRTKTFQSYYFLNHTRLIFSFLAAPGRGLTWVQSPIDILAAADTTKTLGLYTNASREEIWMIDNRVRNSTEFKKNYSRYCKLLSGILDFGFVLDEKFKTERSIALAKAIYVSDQWDLTPKLGDILMDLGFTDEFVLNRLMDVEIPKYKGEWIVDALLNKRKKNAQNT